MTNSTVLVTGNTYPVKDAIKALGGRWDAANKGWRVPAARASEAQALVTGAPKSSPRSGGFASRGYTQTRRPWRPCGYPGCNRAQCDECDGEGYRNGY